MVDYPYIYIRVKGEIGDFLLYLQKNKITFYLMQLLFHHNDRAHAAVFRLPVFSVLLSLLVLCLLCGCGACGGSKPVGCIMPDTLMARCREGDIVLRKGTGIASRVVCASPQSDDYSHCGIIAADDDGRLLVVHAVPDEPDYEGDPDRVKAEPLLSFFSTIRASKGCLLRLSNAADSTLAARAARVAMQVFSRPTLFNHDYDDRDTTRMYCSQLVDYAYLRAGVSLVGRRRHHFNIPGLSLDHVLLPADFMHSARTTTLAEFY